MDKLAVQVLRCQPSRAIKARFFCLDSNWRLRSLSLFGLLVLVCAPSTTKSSLYSVPALFLVGEPDGSDQDEEVAFAVAAASAAAEATMAATVLLVTPAA